LKTDSNDKIDVFKIDLKEVASTFDKGIKVLEFNYIQPLLKTLNKSDLNL
jgi:hypothetical protein